MKQKYLIEGMTCSSCSARIDKIVRHIDGVNDVNVNLLKSNMVITYSDNINKRIVENNIFSEIKKAGYIAYSDMKTIKDSSESMKKRLIFSIIFIIPLLYFSMGKMMQISFPKIIFENFTILSIIQFIFALIISIINRNYFLNGFKNIFRLSPNMDSLIAISTSAAIIYGVYLIILSIIDISLIDFSFNNLYFESAGMIMTMISLGKFFESNAKRKTTDAITKMMKIIPNEITIEENGQLKVISIENIKENDTIIIKNGDIFPVDGIIIEGNATVDESSLTGESRLIDKTINDKVLKSTLNQLGYCKVKALNIGIDTMYDKILQLVDEASNSKAPISKMVDKISRIFVPVVVIISVISFSIWMILDYGFSFSLSTAISVLVVSCPCALGLATPTAIMVSTGVAASNHIILKSADSIEMANKINCVLLDKTGTITTGKPVCKSIKSYNMSKEEFLKYAISLENLSEHPIAKAITSNYKEKINNLYKITNFEVLYGVGVKGNVDNDIIIGGNYKLLSNKKINSLENEDSDYTKENNIYFLKNDCLIGYITLEDEIKETSKLAIDLFNDQGIKTMIVSGDLNRNVEKISKELHVSDYFSEVLPDKKDEIVQYLKKENTVCFIGDGINDSPALTRSDLGIAIGSGTDVAIDCADIVLVKNELLDAYNAINLSKKTIKIMKENLLWAFLYNILLIPMASGLFYVFFDILFKPSYAAISMSISSLFVVLNALRIKSFKPHIYNSDNKVIKEFNEKEIIKTSMIIEMKVNGMMCEHCKKRVEEALNSFEDVKAIVNLQTKIVTITTNRIIDLEQYKQKIESIGYEVVEIKQRNE